jgi:UDP-N-acetyl-D-galactosamine dehydrogenase
MQHRKSECGENRVPPQGNNLLGTRSQPIREQALGLGLTFKENVRDLRNSKVVDLVEELRGHGFDVRIHDPLADPGEAAALYGVDLIPILVGMGPYDCVVGAVAHVTYASFTAETLAEVVQPDGLIADVKGTWRRLVLPQGIRRWQLYGGLSFATNLAVLPGH